MRDFTYLIEPVENGKGGLRMKTKATEETDHCSDAIVWVRLLSYMYDYRAHLRKDCLTKKEHTKLVKVNRMNNMARTVARTSCRLLGPWREAFNKALCQTPGMSWQRTPFH